MNELPFEAVFLVRHGETAWNVQRRRQGRLDSPLTNLGEAQAKAAGSALETQAVDLLATSPTGRAVATAEIIAMQLHLPIAEFDELQEVDHGDWSGLTDMEIDS